MDSQEDSDDFIYCTLCDNFKVPKERKDNFERYMKIHYGITTTCECGIEIAPTSLSRHKKNTCPLMKSNKVKLVKKKKQVEQLTCECGIVINKTSMTRHKKTTCGKKSSILRSEGLSSRPSLGHLVSSTTHKIETTVRTDVYSNGQVIVTHDEINLGEISFVINASSTNQPRPSNLMLQGEIN